MDAVGQDDGTTLVTWTDNSNVEEGYAVEVITCDDYDCFYDYHTTGPNVTSMSLGAWEYLNGVYAYADGGFSDIGTLVGAEGASRIASSPVFRPMKGARAPRPTAAVRSVKARRP